MVVFQPKSWLNARGLLASGLCAHTDWIEEGGLGAFHVEIIPDIVFGEFRQLVPKDRE